LDHAVTLELHGEVDDQTSTVKGNDRKLFITLMKKEEGFWPRLTKDKMKLHFLKTDFNLWKDEDDTEDEEEAPGKEDFNLDAMMSQMGGLNGAQFGGPEGDEGEEEPDSDDEELPDLQ